MTPLAETLRQARLELPPQADVRIEGADPVLPTPFPIGEAAAAALGLCGAAAADIWTLRGGLPQRVTVDVARAAASLTSFAFLSRDGDAPGAAQIERQRRVGNITRFFKTADDRSIHLHAGFPHLRAGTLATLECRDESEVGPAVARWKAGDLEDALAAAGMCGAVARDASEWRAHPQGQALLGLPAVEIVKVGDAEPEPFAPADRPLTGVRALDLTRVLAGPTCGRTLAEHGADVLRISSPRLPTAEFFDVDTGHGKLSAWLDLDESDDAARLGELVRDADVFTQGYRSGALERRGFGLEEVAAMRPGIVYVSINCYGHEGPWTNRPGWEQLAQTVTGTAVVHGTPDKPVLFPAAACDYTTGYLAAFGAMVALARRAREGGTWHVRASLCQTGMWFERLGSRCDRDAAVGVGDVAGYTTRTGGITHLSPVVQMSGTPARWDRPCVPLGTHPAEWP